MAVTIAGRYTLRLFGETARHHTIAHTTPRRYRLQSDDTQATPHTHVDLFMPSVPFWEAAIAQNETRRVGKVSNTRPSGASAKDGTTKDLVNNGLLFVLQPAIAPPWRQEG